MPLRRGENIKFDCAVVDALNVTLAGSAEHLALGALLLGPEGLGLRALPLVGLCRGGSEVRQNVVVHGEDDSDATERVLGECARAFLLSVIT